jgi:hypothetical protein
MRQDTHCLHMSNMELNLSVIAVDIGQIGRGSPLTNTVPVRLLTFKGRVEYQLVFVQLSERDRYL